MYYISVLKFTGNLLNYAQFVSGTQFFFIGGGLKKYGTMTSSLAKQLAFVQKLTSQVGAFSTSCLNFNVAFGAINQFQTSTSTQILKDSISLSNVASPITFTVNTAAWGSDPIIETMVPSQCFLTIIQSIVTDQEYDVGLLSGELSAQFDPYLILTCPGDFVYTLSVTPATTLVTLDAVTRTISWPETMPIGLYSITIEGTLRNTQVLKASSIFSLNIINHCYDATLTPGVLQPIDYMITQSQITHDMPGFWSPLSSCKITYWMLDDQGQAISSALFTFIVDSILDKRTLKIGVQTSNSFAGQSFNLRLYGQYLGDAIDYFAPITVTIKHQCYLTQITTSALSTDLYFDLSQTTFGSTSLTWSHDQSSITCGYLAYSLIDINTNSAPSNQLIQITNFQTNGYLQYVNNPSIMTAATYQLRLTGTVGIYASKNFDFNLHITDNCASLVTITPQAMPEFTYALGSGLRTFTFTEWALDYSYCGPFSYEAVIYNTNDASVSQLDNTWVSFGVYPRQLRIQTSDRSLLALSPLNIQITGKLPKGKQDQVFFNLVLQDPCPTATLIAYSISNRVFTISKNEINIELSWTDSTVGLCGIITYTATQTDAQGQQIAIDSALVQFSSPSNLRIFSSDMTQLAKSPLTIAVTGSLGAWVSQTITFTLTLIDPCVSANLIKRVIPSHTIYAQIDTITYTMTSDFYSSEPISLCGAWNYELTLRDRYGAPVTFPPLVDWDASHRKFTFSTPNREHAYLSPFAVYLKGYQGTYSQNSVSESFSLTVRDPCIYESISKTDIDDYLNYDVVAAPFVQLADLNEWTQTYPTICPPIQLAVFEISQFIGVNIDPTVFTFHQANKSITMYTREPLKAKIYNFRVIGEIFVGTSSVEKVYQDFKVTFKNLCPDAIISAADPLQDQTYTLGSGLKTFSFQAWSENTGVCGPIAYTAYISRYDLNGNYDQLTEVQLGLSSVVSQSFIVFSSRTFQVQTTNLVYVGAYGIRVQGSIPSGVKKSEYFKLTNQICRVLTLAPDSTQLVTSFRLANQNYLLGTFPLNVVIKPMIQSPQCGLVVTYTLLIPRAFVSTANLQSQRTLQIQTSNIAHIGSSILQVTGKLINIDGSSVTSPIIEIPVTIQGGNIGPPIFISQPPNLSSTIGTSLQITLPQISDPDPSDSPYLSSINFGALSTLVRGTYPTYTLQVPSTSTSLVGSHSVPIILNDRNAISPKTTSYTFTITINQAPSLQNLTSSISNDSSSTNLSSIANVSISQAIQNNSQNKTLNQSQQGQSEVKKTAISPSLSDLKQPKATPAKTLKAKIKSVSLDGQVVVSFSQNVKVPALTENATYYPSEFLIFDLSQGADKESLREIKNWTIESFTKSQMVVQMNFMAPLEVSSDTEYDLLRLKFNTSFPLILSENLLSMIDYETILEKDVPPQMMSLETAKRLSAVGESLSNAVLGAITTSIVYSIVAGISVKKLWSMISTMQIITHYPMLSIPLPANVQIVLKALVDIANMGLLPKKYVKDLITSIIKSTGDHTDQKFQDMGFESGSLVQNLGQMFLAIVAFSILGLIVFGLNKLAAKIPMYCHETLTCVQCPYHPRNVVEEAILQLIPLESAQRLPEVHTGNLSRSQLV